MSTLVMTTAGGSANVTVDGKELTEDIKLQRKTVHYYVGDSPICNPTGFCVINNEIHITGVNGTNTSLAQSHYKWNGTSWIEVGTLPFSGTRFFVLTAFNNEIHVIYTVLSGLATSHYKWDGKAWVYLGALPSGAYYFSHALILDNEIYALGQEGIYKWDYSGWTFVGKLPYTYSPAGAVVFNNEIHILGNSSSSSEQAKHYKWDGSSWVSVSTLPISVNQCGTIIFENAIHLIQDRNHYKWDGNKWTNLDLLPKLNGYTYAIVLNHEILIFRPNVSLCPLYNIAGLFFREVK